MFLHLEEMALPVMVVLQLEMVLMLLQQRDHLQLVGLEIIHTHLLIGDLEQLANLRQDLSDLKTVSDLHLETNKNKIQR
jgi:hypothetical protein